MAVAVAGEPAEVASLNAAAKPWSPTSSQGLEMEKKIDSADEGADDEVVLRDAFVADEGLSWGMQALTGMAEKMFPDEDEKSQQTASPALSISPRGRDPLPRVLEPTPPPPPARCWSPTISHTLVNSCAPSASAVDDCMEDAYKKLKMQITCAAKLETVKQSREEAQDEEDDATSNGKTENGACVTRVVNHQYNEELLLRLHKTGGIPAHELPNELFIARRLEPELAKKYPTLLTPHNHSNNNNNHHGGSYQYYGENGTSPKWKREACRYYAQGSCRKMECPFYHDPAMYSPEMQAAYEMGMMKQAQMERDYTILLNDVLQQEMVEKQRDATDGVKSGDRTVYIVGIDSSTSDENILIRLSHFGSIRKYQLCGDPNQPTRYGFFEYNTVAAARGCQTIDCKKMFTRPIRVSKAKDAIKGGRNVPELHQMELLRAAVMCQIQNIEAPCVKGSGRPATILDEPTPPPGKGRRGHEGRAQSPQRAGKEEAKS